VNRAKKIAAAMEIIDRGRGRQFDLEMVRVLAGVVR
jgi:HD-GYP domain-containing protein (c-di-GMP phosphodiesterase class II)